MTTDSERPRHILPIIVAVQFAGGSLWFAGNAVLANLKAAEAVRAVPYMPFRDNHTGVTPGIWHRHYHFFKFHEAKFICHNLCVLNTAMSTLGMDAEFWGKVLP